MRLRQKKKFINGNHSGVEVPGFPGKRRGNPVLSNLSQRRLLVTLETHLRVRLLHLFTPDNRLNAPCENERGQLTAAEAFGTVIEWKL
jgi:hypothetical protein